MFIGELLRLSSVAQLEEDAARERVVVMRAAARNGKLHRALWEQQIYSVIVEGRARRGHLIALISAEALRDVGFTAAQLLSSGFVLSELREGGFTCDGLRAAGLKAAELQAAGFTPSEMRLGGFSAR